MSRNFQIDKASYLVVEEHPNPEAKYGLGLTFWYSNLNEMVFTLEYINKTWTMRNLIDIAICSHAQLTPEQYVRISPLVNYVVYAQQDMGKLNGTTVHCNGSLKVLLDSGLKTVCHTDVDVSFINQTYFFGHSSMLYDSGRVILTSQDTLNYDMTTMGQSIYTQHDIDQHHQFGSTFILNTERAKQTGYFPFPLLGHFERDRYTKFIQCGLSVEKDALIVPRAPIDTDIPTNFLYSFDFHLGIVHNSNALEYPETEDRKLRLLKLMSCERWEDLPLGWNWNYNPKSPRPNYKRVEPPKQENHP
jgi:hypothetical protein